MATVPLWVAVVISVGSPLLAFLGLLLGQVLTRRSARETETRWQREESMRLLRWAAELTTDAERSRAGLGLVTLKALAVSPLLQQADLTLIGAVLREAIRRTGLDVD
jgi:hypothetical protein